ncbi:polyphosphate kinase 2 (PPK2 family) [Methanomicrobium sp. W14]|uniref:phosphate--AMP phosphotransferase n=1 Tax=Methanomicrobium sp. W14 TaxID=2817839 RepID=UPI001AE10D7C|nr:phosphate--AMP phosphotransferase [Methanomicrobium sp. W14]MBP2132737.1 polyphosphate kinase 2 (PPK2 family) [Methanomicrobium sp. W14]
MLKNVNPDLKISKHDYNEEIDSLKLRLGELQRELRNSKIPVIIVFEGWDAAGIAKVCNKVIRSFDPRGYTLYHIGDPGTAEKSMPLFWRFWKRIPSKGNIVIFDRSWYSRILHEDIRISRKCRVSINYSGIFERQLYDDGYLIIKLFLHISKHEQKKRFKNPDDDPCLKYYIKNTDWNPNDDYDKYYPYIDDILNETDYDFAPWNIIESDDPNFAVIKTYRLLIKYAEDFLSARKTSDSQFARLKYIPAPERFTLPDAEPDNPLNRDDYLKLKKKHGKEIQKLQAELYKKRIPLILLFEGWDASGKGGAIVRFTEYLNPRGYRIIPISAPSDAELKYNYLWRFYKELPIPGMIRIFDRSWYGRVLVERVEELCSDYEWQRAYHEINELEEQLLEWGAVVIKFWMHIDKDEQLRRFRERQNNPYKQWKITEEDWRNRSKWDKYELAVSDMVRLTSTEKCPWNIVLGNNKYNARIQTLSTIENEIKSKIQEIKNES